MIESINGLPWQEFRRRQCRMDGIVQRLREMPEVASVRVREPNAKRTKVSVRITLNLRKGDGDA